MCANPLSGRELQYESVGWRLLVEGNLLEVAVRELLAVELRACAKQRPSLGVDQEHVLISAGRKPVQVVPRHLLPRNASDVMSGAPSVLNLPDCFECEPGDERRGIDQKPCEDETGLLGDLLAERPQARSSPVEALSVGDCHMQSRSVFVFLAEQRRSLDPKTRGCLLRLRGRLVIVPDAAQPHYAAGAFL